MSQRALNSDRVIVQIEEEYSSTGLFRRYAHGRIKGFGERQAMTLTGSLALAYITNPWWGLIAYSSALIGDRVEIACLRRWLRQLEKGADIRRLLHRSTAVAALQALSISICFLIAWFVPRGLDTTFFCCAYLMIAAMNAGALKSFHSYAATVRITIYVLVGGICFALKLLFYSGVTFKTGFDLLAAVMLAYMAKVFIDHVSKNFKRHRQSERDLIRWQKSVEQSSLELEEQQKELRILSMVAWHANDSIILSNTQGEITWVNAAFSKMLGYTSEEAVGRLTGELLNSKNTSPAVIEDLKSAVGQGKPWRGEILNQRKDGEEILVETNVVPVVNSRGEIDVIVGVERDITQAKVHAQELAEARQDAERRDRAKSEFLTTMSDEIRVPLKRVMGALNLLVQSDLSDDQKRFANSIRTSAQALLKSMSDIYDLSKMDVGKLTIDPVDFAPGPCVRDTIDLQQASAQEKGLYLDVNFETRLPALLHGDDGRLRQILQNLIGNAIKFTDNGGVTVSVSHSFEGANIRFKASVKDTGIGIPEDKINAIFDDFSQAETATTRRFGDVGLGLAISRRLAQIMGGNISARSEEGNGSEFLVNLLFEPPQNDAIEAERSKTIWQ
ncbi:MAG: ATP-binding protein [Marinovum sp.]|nr:ATP-binding protein [Marinovum sp.]